MTIRKYLLLGSGLLLAAAVVFGPSGTAGALNAEAMRGKAFYMEQAQLIQPAESVGLSTWDWRTNASRTVALQSPVLAAGPSETFHDCGFFTCTIWWSWSRTKYLNDKFNGPMAGAKALTAGVIGGLMCYHAGPVASVCAAGILIRYTMIANHLEDAVKKGKCSAWKYNKPIFLPGPTLPVPAITIVGLETWDSHKGRTCK